MECPLDNTAAAAYTNYLRNPKGQRDFIAAYATGVMVQRELKEEELIWIVEQSLKTPYYIAANLFCSGLFSDYRVEAADSSESLPTLFVVDENWAGVATTSLRKLAHKASVELLGRHLMFWEYSEKFNGMV
ncbi:hypothetical protein ACIGEL_19420 [Rossellomorea aquimaris]|uniref:hypothetical protein n=1 Tax=Rossellomorea aquimaris TaxID=189382 RepID=UPI0037CADFF3